MTETKPEYDVGVKLAGAETKEEQVLDWKAVAERSLAENEQLKAELSLFQNSYTALWRTIATMPNELIGRPVPQSEQRQG